MISKNLQNIICVAILFLFTNQAWAAEWIYFASNSYRDSYYDKSDVKRLDNNVIRVWTKHSLNEKGKMKIFSSLEGEDKKFSNYKLISYVSNVSDIDCVNKKIKDYSTIIYGETSNILYSSQKDNAGNWDDIVPNSVADKLKNMLCKEPNAHEQAFAATPRVNDKSPAQAGSKQSEKKYIPEDEIRNLVAKWLRSWKSGDIETYRSCYATDFHSHGVNLNDWITNRTNEFKNNKNINIGINGLQISVAENAASAVFTQNYSSSISQYSGKKTLVLKKVDNEWKIYRETIERKPDSTQETFAVAPLESKTKSDQLKPDQKKIPTIDVKDIRYLLGKDGKESVFVEFNCFCIPAISVINGERPMIVLEIANISSLKNKLSNINVQGKLIKGIRSSLISHTNTARIVLDMEPSKDYYVNPNFYKKENIYSLEIYEKKVSASNPQI